MKSISSRFKKAAAALGDWAAKNKLKAVACASFAAAGGSGALLWQVEHNVSDQQARDREWQTLQMDLVQLRDSYQRYKAISDFAEVSPGTYDIPIDPGRLKQETDRHTRAFSATSERALDDLAFARNLSIADIKEWQEQVKKELPQSDWFTGHSAEKLRACQQNVMSRPGYQHSESDGWDIRECVYFHPGPNRYAMLQFLVMLSLTTAAVCSLAARRAAKNTPAPPVPAAPAAASAPVPAKPIRILSPLRLKLKGSPP